MRRDVIHMRERTTASGIRTEAVECNHGESHTNGASSPPPLSLFFFSFFFSFFSFFFWGGGKGGTPEGAPPESQPPPHHFLFFKGKDLQSEYEWSRTRH